MKVSRRCVGGMAYSATSKVVILSGTYWSPPRTKTLLSAKVGPYIGSNVVTSCDDEYIEKTSRTFGERYKEHPKNPSPIHQQSNHMGYPSSHNNFQIIGREGHSLARNIKESIFIRANNPTLNRNIGKFNLPHIWDRVLLNTPGLNLKRHLHTVGHVNSNNPNTPISILYNN